MRFRGKDARRQLLAAGAALAAAALAPAAASASSAVVLVSGFDTSTPFSTSAPACAGQEGATWGDPSGPAAALKAAGLTVFTAPVAQSGGAPPPACVGPDQPTPPAAATINSNGDINANGAALASFLGFLRAGYGVDRVALVGHSAGGLWSRSAITQLDPSAGVAVESLTTLATPHTGSFGADLAETLVNGECRASNPVEQAICQAVLAVLRAVYEDLGATTIHQLTNTFLQGWNPQQRIGCPVTVMGGTYVDIPLVPLSYYNPNDGIVGKASALNTDALSITLTPIPAAPFQPIGSQTFPVVHSATLTFLTPSTMLNQAAISAAVVAAVQAQAGAAPCATASAATTRAAHARGIVSAVSAGADDGSVRVEASLHSLHVPRQGRLALPRQGAALALLGGAEVRCGDAVVPSTPVLGSRELRLAAPRCATPLRVTGGRVLALRAAPKRSLVVTRRGDALRARLVGPGLQRRVAHVRVGARWRALPLGRAVTVDRDAHATVRVVGRDRRGERYAATAHVAAP